MKIVYNNGTHRQFDIEKVKTLKHLKKLRNDIKEDTTVRSDWHIIAEIDGWAEDETEIKILSISNKSRFKDIVWNKISYYSNRLFVMPKVGLGNNFERIYNGLYGQYARFDCESDTVFVIEISL